MAGIGQSGEFAGVDHGSDISPDSVAGCSADGRAADRHRDARVVRTLLRRPDLAASTTLTWFFNLAFGPVEVALPVFVTRTLHAGPTLLGAYWAAFGAGAALGALALPAARRLPPWPAMVGIVAAHGAALLPFAFTGGVLPSLTGFALAGVVYGPYTALALGHVQERVPPSALTAVLALRGAVLLTAAPLGAFLGGAVVERTGASALVVGCGGAMVLLAVPAALVSLRRAPRR